MVVLFFDKRNGTITGKSGEGFRLTHNSFSTADATIEQENNHSHLKLLQIPNTL
jgi:hypothetical protein